MPINTPDSARILYPTGLVMDPALVSSGANSTDTSPGLLSDPVPGLLVTAHRIGQFTLFHSGARGTLEANIVAGAAGTARMVARLSKTLSDITYRVQISLDTTNRPITTIVANGVTVASWTAGGSAIAVGTPMLLKLTWDSDNAAFGGLHASFTLDGVAPGGSWGTSPASAWVSAPLEVMTVGFADTFGDFNGTLRLVQTGDLL